MEFTRETTIGVVVAGLAVAAMAIDHLIPGDAAAFLVTTSVALVTAIVIFGRVIPATKASPRSSALSAKRGVLLSGLAVVSIPTLFVGIPFVLGGGGVALGLLARNGDRRRLGLIALVLGGLVVAFSAGVYLFVGDSGG